MVAYLAEGIITGRLTYERVANSPLVHKRPEILEEINEYLIKHKKGHLIPKKEPIEDNKEDSEVTEEEEKEEPKEENSEEPKEDVEADTEEKEPVEEESNKDDNKEEEEEEEKEIRIYAKDDDE